MQSTFLRETNKLFLALFGGLIMGMLVPAKAWGQIPVVGEVQINAVPCANASNGQLTIVVEGGSPPYAFSIDGGASFQDADTFADLPAGQYTAMVKDQSGQFSVSYPVSLEAASPLELYFRPQSPTCPGKADGQIELAGKGGTPPYEFSRDGGANFADQTLLSGLAADEELKLQIRDANGCVSNVQTFSIEAPRPVAAKFVAQDPRCVDSEDGSVTFQAWGGSGEYLYSIDGGVNFLPLPHFSGLKTGNYQLVVRDALADCPRWEENLELKADSPLQLELAATDPTCMNRKNGRLESEVQGGQRPFSYRWSNGGRTPDLVSLSEGNYALTVTDARGCKASDEVLLNPAAPLVLQTPECQGFYLGASPDKSLTIVAPEATNGAALSYRWSTGANGKEIVVRPRASHGFRVTATDAAGCKASAVVPVEVVDARCGTGLNQVVLCLNGSPLCVDPAEVDAQLRRGAVLGPCGVPTPCTQELVPAIASTAASSAAAQEEDTQSGQSTQQATPPVPTPIPDTTADSPQLIADISEITFSPEELPAFLQHSGDSRTADANGYAEEDAEGSNSLLFDSAPGRSQTGISAEVAIPPAPPEDGLAAKFDPGTGLVKVQIECPNCDPYQSLTLDIRDGGNDVLLYTGPVTIVKGSGEVQIPISDDVDRDGLKVQARGESQLLQSFIPGPTAP